MSLVVSTAGFAFVLPEHIGDYQQVSTGDVPGRLDLLSEYDLQEASRGVYRNAAGRSMSAEVYRFETADGGYAAYLSMTPPGAVKSPLDETVPFSESEISGPVGLKRFAPQLWPAAVAFHNDATGWLARFELPGGPVTRIVLQYPSHQIVQDVTKCSAS